MRSYIEQKMTEAKSISVQEQINQETNEEEEQETQPEDTEQPTKVNMQ